MCSSKASAHVEELAWTSGVGQAVRGAVTRKLGSEPLRGACHSSGKLTVEEMSAKARTILSDREVGKCLLGCGCDRVLA